jgi:hypothetical protein
MTWPWALYMGEAINPFGDVIVQMTSLRWNAHALVTNPLGLFEAPFFYPYAHSLAFSENLIGQTLLALPLLWLTGNAALAANFNILLSFVLTGVFTYLLVRDLTGSRAAGIFAGVAFAFCPFRFMQMGHLHMLATQWFPLTLWGLVRGLGIRDRRSAARTTDLRPWIPNPSYIFLAAFGFAMMGLSSVYYIYFLALAVLFFVGWWLLVEARGRHMPWQALLPRALAAVLALAILLGPVYLPYLQTNQELGFSRSTYEVQNWAAEWSFFGEVLTGNWLYAQVLAPDMASPGGERQLFFGLVPALLAVVGVIRGRGHTRFFFVLLGLVALVLTFGLSAHVPGTSLDLPLPYALFYEWVPGFKALRVPVRFAVLLDLAIYVLAGYGIARLWTLDFGPSRRKEQSRMALAGVLTALVLLEFINPLDTANRRDVTAQLQTMEPYGWLSRPENSGPVLELPMTAGQEDVWYTFYATRHWQPLVNGWSSFVPPGTVHLKQALDAFPDPFTVSLLQGLEVRHIVVHLWQFPADVQADLKRRLDQTPELEMVNQAGNNYVYRLAPDPWLRKVADQVGDGTIWVGEARHGSMPTLEVLAYALQRWGVKKEQIGGNITMGHKPIGWLPFGTAADYVLLPGAQGAEGAPLGYETMQPILQNAAARLLAKDFALLKSYDLTHPDAPNLSEQINLGVGASGVSFAGELPAPNGAITRSLDLSFVSFETTGASVEIADDSMSLPLKPGVSRYITPGFSVPHDIKLTLADNKNAHLMRVDLWSTERTRVSGLEPQATLMALEVGSASGNPGLDTRLKAAVPLGGGDYTATIDVYVEPWGTHPQGHFGSWSVVLPADGAGHDYDFRFDPVAKTVTTVRDGRPVETFAWVGPPGEGDFRASLNITRGNSLIASVPLYTFTLRGGRVAGVQLEPASLSIAQP